MEITVSQQDAVTVIAISGSIDASNAFEVADAFQAQIDQGNARLVVDLGMLDFTSSAGLRSIVRGLKTARDAGGNLCVASLKDEVLRIFQLSGLLDDVLESFPDVANAVQHMSA